MKTKSIVATILLITLTFSVFTPMLIRSSTASGSFTMPQKEDIFKGTFSPAYVSLVPNQVVDVSFSICPTMDVPGTTIQFFMPGDLVKLVNGELVWTGDVKEGETVTLQLSIMVEREVDVGVKAEVKASPEGKAYSSSYSLHVSSISPENVGKNVAPAIQISPSPSTNPASQRQANPSPSTNSSPSPGGTITIEGTMYYVNEWGGYSPMRYVLVELWDDDTGPDEYCTNTWTDANGHFSITWNNDDGLLQDGRDPYIHVCSEGAWDWITKSPGLFGGRYVCDLGECGDDVPDGFYYNYGSLAPVSYNEAWEAGDAVFAEADWIYAWTGWYRSKVTIIWPTEDWPHSHGDEIDLPDKSMAWWGHATVQHEEGHCVMWALYGYWPPGPGPTTKYHYLASESSGGFAFTEGWAEFMQAAVDNNPNNCASWGMNIETNTWYNGPFWTPEGWIGDSGDMDGNIIEGSVASILWDIYDGTSTADKDALSLGFDDIFWILHDYKPRDMYDFWSDWYDRYLVSIAGPLSTIYWDYGINEDWYAPWGSININSGAPYTNSRWVTLNLDGEDYGSGVAYMRFSTNCGTWSAWEPYAITKSYYLSTIDAPKDDWWIEVDVQFMDVVGYTTGEWTIFSHICLDTTPPTGSIIINSGNPTYTTTTSVTLYLTYSDATSGVYKVRYADEGGFWGAWEDPAATKAWTLPSGDGLKYVYYQIKDNSGLISEYYDGIVLDTVAPVTTISHSPGSSSVSLSATDATSGVQATYYRIDAGSWVTYTGAFKLAVKGNITIDYYSVDNAGNNETTKTLIVHYLTVNTNPAGITKISGSGWYDHGTTAKTGTAPTNVTSRDIEYTFSTWKKDRKLLTGNPISVLMDAPHTATAVYWAFYVSASPLTRIIVAGTSTTYNATAKLLVGTTQLVSWSASGLPSGATCSFTPSFGYSTFNSTLKINTLATTLPGTYTITITGTGPYGNHSTTVTMNVMNFSVLPNPFSPNSDGVKDKTTIKAIFWASITWSLKIKNSTGTVVRDFGSATGSSLTMIWDGKDGSGNIVPEGTYTIYLSGPGFTKTKTVTVDITPPTVTSVSVNPTSFNPKLGQKTKINYTLSESCYVTIKIFNSTGNLVKPLLNNVLQAASLHTVVWNGRNDAGNIVPVGTYKIKIYVTDKAGNRATPYPITKTVTVTT